jgi:hypothetical protein
MNLERFTSPALIQARREADAYENQKIFEPYADYDATRAYTQDEVVWWGNNSYYAKQFVAAGIAPNARDFWQILGSQRGYYRDQTSLEHRERKEYVNVTNDLLGPTWRDVYIHKKELSAAESALLNLIVNEADKAQRLIDYRKERIPRIQQKSIELGVFPGLLIDDSTI